MSVPVPWEGAPSVIKARIGRGSAAGASMSGNPWHEMAGYNAAMQPRTTCGLTFVGQYTLRATVRAKDDEPRCQRCERIVQ